MSSVQSRTYHYKRTYTTHLGANSSPNHPRTRLPKREPPNPSPIAPKATQPHPVRAVEILISEHPRRYRGACAPGRGDGSGPTTTRTTDLVMGRGGAGAEQTGARDVTSRDQIGLLLGRRCQREAVSRGVRRSRGVAGNSAVRLSERCGIGRENGRMKNAPLWAGLGWDPGPGRAGKLTFSALTSVAR